MNDTIGCNAPRRVLWRMSYVRRRTYDENTYDVLNVVSVKCLSDAPCERYYLDCCNVSQLFCVVSGNVVYDNVVPCEHGLIEKTSTLLSKESSVYPTWAKLVPVTLCCLGMLFLFLINRSDFSGV